MAQQQQTVLRVQKNASSGVEVIGSAALSVVSSNNVTYVGNGTEVSPYTGFTTGGFGFGSNWFMSMNVSGGTGTFYYDVDMIPYQGTSSNVYDEYFISFQLSQPTDIPFIVPIRTKRGMGGFTEYNVSDLRGSFKVYDGDRVVVSAGASIPTGSTFNFYLVPDNETTISETLTYDTLDLYNDIPIKLNKSFAELQDIGKRNSDYSVGLSLPGSKKNNAFFENYFDVNTNSLFFDVTRRVNIDVLMNDEKYFEGYMRLNKVSVINSKVEYDVTLYSSVADLYGQIGNNLLKDLDYNDMDWHFNHYFTMYNVASTWSQNTLQNNDIIPSLWLYPIVHNGYEYTGDTVNLSGGTITSQTRLYTSTNAGSFPNYAAFISAGGQEFRINSPRNPILANQLKPGLNMYALIHLMFKNYGYTIKSEFFETPWFKLLYMYGFYSYDGTKFGYKTPVSQLLPLEGVDVLLTQSDEIINEFNCDDQYQRINTTLNLYVVKKGTGIPVLCSSQINVILDFEDVPCFGGTISYTNNFIIPQNTTGATFTYTSEQYVDCGFGCPFQVEYTNFIGFNALQSNVSLSSSILSYLPEQGNVINIFEESVGGNNYVDFSLVIDENIKQIDILSSIAKKFNLVLIPDPDVPNQLIIEPYDYYIGSGVIYDWTDKLSFDKGFTVQPALNFVESELILTDQEDGDEANKTFKDRNKLIYGENRVYNPTDFKSQSKKIDTIFTPEVIRKWDDRIGIPLGINYAGQSNSQPSGNSEIVTWKYTGLKQKPRLIYNLGNLAPFLNQVGQSIDFGSSVNVVVTNFFRIQPSTGVNFDNNTEAFFNLVSPVISHTMPYGNPDSNKSGRGFNNDSICVLFNSEEPDDIGLGIPTFNAYTDQDAYQLFYSNRVNNLYNKNTRFLSGQFDLKLSDIKNLQPKDLIKIQEQYFYVNKLEGYDLTNPELTKVELVQTNNSVRPSPYPTRYFKYVYCNETNNRVYKFRTFFNAEENTQGELFFLNFEKLNSIRRTYYYWSIFYDYMVGVLGGGVTSITSSYNDVGSGNVWAYTMTEITEEEYNNSNYLFWYEDENRFYFIERTSFSPRASIINNQLIYVFANDFGVSYSKAFFNVAVDCPTFLGYCAANDVILSPAPGTAPASPYRVGVVINVTDTGWIKYDTKTATVYKFLSTLGNTTLTDCLLPSSIRDGIPFADLARWTVVSTGTAC
jgi:hypothetical protein